MKAPINYLATHYAGIAYRSRTEARWATFFDAVGIRFNYEWEGFGLDAGWYLPDFWLPDLKMFFEVKGKEPTDDESRKCAELADRRRCDVILAPGPPKLCAEMLLFMPDVGEMPGRYVFAQDRFVEFGFWLVAVPDDIESRWIGPLRVMDGCRGGPMFAGVIEQAFEIAGNARFERGDGKERQRQIPERDPERLWSVVNADRSAA